MWVLKLLLPYLKNPREPQKETATINSKRGNNSLVLKPGIEFVQWQSPWEGSGTSPAPWDPQEAIFASSCSPSSCCSADSTSSRIQRGTMASGSRISSCVCLQSQRLSVRKKKTPHASKPLLASAQHSAEQADGTPLFQWAGNVVLPSRQQIWDKRVLERINEW